MARLCVAGEVLRAEVKERNPGTQVDWIGDAAHQQRSSDHNPNAAGVVCAIDVYPSGSEPAATGKIDMDRFAEFVRTSGHPDLKYVIHDRRIALRSSGFAWLAYTGTDPHTGHVHVSFGVGPDGASRPPYDDPRPWGWAHAATPAPAPVPAPDWEQEIINAMETVNLSHVTTDAATFVKGSDVKRLQGLLLADGFGPAGLVDTAGRPDGIAGPKTRELLGQFQGKYDTGDSSAPATPDYIAGPATWRALLAA